MTAWEVLAMLEQAGCRVILAGDALWVSGGRLPEVAGDLIQAMKGDLVEALLEAQRLIEEAWWVVEETKRREAAGGKRTRRQRPRTGAAGIVGNGGDVGAGSAAPSGSNAGPPPTGRHGGTAPTSGSRGRTPASGANGRESPGPAPGDRAGEMTAETRREVTAILRRRLGLGAEILFEMEEDGRTETEEYRKALALYESLLCAYRMMCR